MNLDSAAFLEVQKDMAYDPTTEYVPDIRPPAQGNVTFEKGAVYFIAPHSLFGYSVCITDDFILVGAVLDSPYGQTTPMAGSVYQYDQAYVGEEKKIAIHGDPALISRTAQKKSKQHFWLETGELTTLLSWVNVRRQGEQHGDKLTLKGETFGPSSKTSQWFKRFLIEANGKPVLELSSFRHAHVQNSSLLRTMALSFNGSMPGLLPTTPVPLEGVSNLFVQSRRIHGRQTFGAAAEELLIRTPSLSLAITAKEASKFVDEKQSARFAHLQLNIVGALPQRTTGLLAELAGPQRRSEATKAAKQPPAEVLANRKAHAAMARLKKLKVMSSKVTSKLKSAKVHPHSKSSKTQQHGGGGTKTRASAKTHAGSHHSSKLFSPLISLLGNLAPEALRQR